MNIGFILVSVPVILTLLAFIYVAYVAGKFAHSKPTQSPRENQKKKVQLNSQKKILQNDKFCRGV